jgi:hypothetical protein
VSAAQNDAWYIACRTHIAAVATLVTARTWWVHTRVFVGGGGRVLEIAPASNRVSKLITMVIKKHKCPAYPQLPKKLQSTQFWYITVIVEKSNTRPRPLQHYFEFLETPSTMTVL